MTLAGISGQRWRRCASVLCIFLASVAAEIYRFDGSETLAKGAMRARPGIMYKAGEAPSNRSPGNGVSFIQLSLEFQVDTAVTTNDQEVQVFILQGTTPNFEDELGVADPNNKGSRIVCDENGKFIAKDVKDPITVKFEKGHTMARIPADMKTYTIQETGRHTVVMSNCKTDQPVTVLGQTVWMNPFGYLPGHLYGYLPVDTNGPSLLSLTLDISQFYGLMSSFFLIIGGVWGLMNAFYWKDVVMLQNCISGVMGLCMVEMATWYFDYLNYNQTGIRSPGPFTVGVFTSVLRRSVSRMLVIAVSLGFGVVRPSLGDDTKKICVLGAAYCVFGFMLELTVHYAQTETAPQNWRLVLTLPVAALDAVCYWWIFISLYTLMKGLEARKQSVKYQLYQRFFAVLVISLILATGFAFYQVWYMNTQQFETDWENYWFLEHGFWQMLYTGVLLAIMFLWRPNKNSQRYAYAELGSEDMEEDEDSVMEFAAAEVSTRPKSTRPKPVAVASDPLFEIGDEGEDDDLLDPNVVSKMS